MQGQDLDLAPGYRVYRDEMRISELADQVGVPTSTVRYYERVGLLGPPSRTASGYRDYDEESATRLLFIARSRRLGLSCEQITGLLPAWDGANCSTAHERVGQLIDERKAEIAAQIRELRALSAQLDDVRSQLAATRPPTVCRSDLSCCVPEPELLQLGFRR